MTVMQYDEKREILLRNIDSYFTARLGYEVTGDSRDLVVRMNEAIIERLEEHLGDRFLAVGLPTFLVDTDNGQEPVPVRAEQLRTVEDFDIAVGDLTQQIACKVLDDEVLNLFVHSPVLPGGFTQDYNPGGFRTLDLTRWRSRFNVHPGRLLVQPHNHSESKGPPEGVRPRDPGYYPDFRQYPEGTTPVED